MQRLHKSDSASALSEVTPPGLSWNPPDTTGLLWSWCCTPCPCTTLTSTDATDSEPEPSFDCPATLEYRSNIKCLYYKHCSIVTSFGSEAAIVLLATSDVCTRSDLLNLALGLRIVDCRELLHPKVVSLLRGEDYITTQGAICIIWLHGFLQCLASLLLFLPNGHPLLPNLSIMAKKDMHLYSSKLEQDELESLIKPYVIPYTCILVHLLPYLLRA
nr:hypothetical protein [Tanacetum cinerariifolium]GEX74263.1 hypothetical protein [Tanacetum cinerariifolium]